MYWLLMYVSVWLNNFFYLILYLVQQIHIMLALVLWQKCMDTINSQHMLIAILYFCVML